MRRSIPIVAAALGLGLALTACSGDTGSNTPTTTPAPQATTTEAPKLSGELSMWVDEERIKDLKGVAADFEAEYGVKVNLTQKAFGDIKTDFVAQGAQEGGPDVVVGANDWTGELVANGLVAPIQLGAAAAELSDGGKAAFSDDGALYGVPYAVENIALIRNNAIVKETPDTFEALLKQNDELKKEFPIVVQQDPKNGDSYHLYPLMTSFGISFFKQAADGTYVKEVGFGGEQGTKFAEWLAAQGKNGAGWLSGDITGDVATPAFRDGKTPYIITGPWNVVGDKGRFVESGMDVSVLPVPSAGGDVSRPFAGFQGFFVNATSKNALAANAFVSYLATSDVQTKLYKEGGRIPVNTVSAAVVDDPILKGFAAAGVNAVPQPGFKEMDAVWGQMGSTQIQIIDGKAKDPAKTWADMVDTISGLL
ncbi:extracellular solute-binding protein [Sanguibacter sp. HDW7]|uniref:sugar ABC transporter substrate-binding protein n=1 Tax=Sanguibacter sp. HDW7 TaxID=2714931 RepID=UPI001408B1AC|nr:extracellular solute-binding protein [Sanguibacter sp. HDW7]QIK83794.1 extracellular solute-binding protein [Sanguibacter sp. HDW7]